MGGCNLFYADQCIASISSGEELSHELNRIRQGFDPPNPTFALVHANQNKLEISLSAQGCYLQYKDASGVPPFFSSVGNQALESGADLHEFRLSKEKSAKIPKRNLITYDEMLRAAQWFVSHGVWPSGVLEWEML